MIETATSPTETEHVAAITSLAARALEVAPEALDPSRPLASYGLDSLAAVELHAALQRLVGQRLPETLLTDHPDLHSLAAYLDRARHDDAYLDPIARMRADAMLPEWIRPRQGTRESGVGQSVLLTGATGFLGGHLVRALARAGVRRIHCLVRAPSARAGQTRIVEAMMRYGSWNPALARVVTAVPGDLAQPRLGLDARNRASLVAKIDAVVHAGAAVDWVGSYGLLRDVNVVATRELLALACEGAPKSFTLVSSLAVCYSTRGPRAIAENYDPMSAIRGLHLGYAQSKAVAETLVRTAAVRGLRASIVRPALITGHETSALGNPQDFLTALLRGCIAMGAAPDLDWSVDACPVGFVSDAIVRLAHTAADPLTVFALTNPSPRHWREVALWLRLYGYPVELIPHAAWLAKLEREGRERGHPLRPLLPFFRARPAGEGGLTLPELHEDRRHGVIDSATTDRALADRDLVCPRLDARLLDRYFARFVADGVVPAPRRTQVHAKKPHVSQRPRADLDRDFVTRGLRERFTEARVVALRERPSAHLESASIISELCSWRCGRAAGLSRYEVELDGHGRRSSLPVVVKRKVSDRNVLDVAIELAHACSPALGQAFASHAHLTPLCGGGRREVAIYAEPDPRLLRHTPTVYALAAATAGSAIALEDIGGIALFDTAERPEQWGDAEIDAVLRGLAEIHAVGFGRDLAELGRLHVAPAPEGTALAELRQATVKHAAPWLERWLGRDGATLANDLASADEKRRTALATHPRTLIHNDFNPRNLALRDTASGLRLCAYDWELATIDVPQRDLAEFLCFVLPESVTWPELARWVERHRRLLGEETSVALDEASWLRGFQLALDDFLVDRLAMYTIVHRFRAQRFLERVVRRWAWLHELCAGALGPSLP